MTKIRKRQANKSYEIYLALYQAVTGNEEEKNIYWQFSPDFFDLIIIDECHRGSAAVDSAWREILRRWSGAEKKQVIIDELSEQGVFFEALADEIGWQSGKEFDPFDLVCHVAWDMPPLTRKERAEQVKKRNYFTQYGEQARRVLEALLDKYADEGMAHIEETQILTIAPFTEIGTPLEIIRAFGGLEQYQQAVHDLEDAALPFRPSFPRRRESRKVK